MRPKKIQPLYFEFLTGRHCSLLDFFQSHPRILLFFPYAHSLSPLHLRQHRCCLREPESHLHSTVERDGRRQCSTRLLLLTGRGIQCPNAAVAVRPQRAHAEFVSQGQGLTVVVCGWLDLWGITMCGDVAKEAQGVRLVAAFLLGPGQSEG